MLKCRKGKSGTLSGLSPSIHFAGSPRFVQLVDNYLVWSSSKPGSRKRRKSGSRVSFLCSLVQFIPGIIDSYTT